MMLLDWRGLAVAVAVRIQVWLSQQMFGLLERKCPRPSWGGISFFGEKILVNLFFCGGIDGGREKVREGDDSSIDGTHLGIFPDSCADMISFNSFSFPAQGIRWIGDELWGRRDFILMILG